MKTFNDLKKGDKFFFESDLETLFMKTEIFSINDITISSEYGYMFLDGKFIGNTFKIDESTSHKQYSSRKSEALIRYAG